MDKSIRSSTKLHGSTGTSNEAQRVMLAPGPGDVKMFKYVLFGKSLKGNATRWAIFEELNDFFSEQKIN